MDMPTFNIFIISSPKGNDEVKKKKKDNPLAKALSMLGMRDKNISSKLDEMTSMMGKGTHHVGGG